MVKTTKLLNTLIFLIAALFFSACSDSSVTPGASNDVSSSIPTDASGVMLMNVKSMMEKGDYKEFQQTEIFANFLKDVEKENPALVPFVKDPAATGVDVTGNMGMYVKIAKDIEKSDLAMILPVADPAKVKAALAELLKNEKEITTTDKEGYTLYAMENNAYFVQSDRILAFTTFSDDAKIKTMINPEGNGIRDNKKFTDQIPKGKDMVYWFDVDPIVEVVLSDPKEKLRIEGVLSSANIPTEGLKNNTFYGFNDFQKGKSEAELICSFSDPLKEELGDLVAEKMNINYTKYIPETNLGIALSFGVNGKGMLSFLAKRGLDKQVDQQLAMLDLNLGAIEEGITGDLAVGLYPPAEGISEPTLVVALGLKDKAFMENLMGKAPIPMVMPKEGENYVFSRGEDMMGNEMPKYYARIVEDAMIISNNFALFEQSLAGKSNKNIQPLQQGWLGMFMDYNVINENFDMFTRAFPMVSPMVLSELSNSIKYQNTSTAYLVAKGAKITAYANNKDKNTNALKSSLISWNEMYKAGVLDNTVNESKEDLDAELKALEKEFEEAAKDIEDMVEEDNI